MSVNTNNNGNRLYRNKYVCLSRLVHKIIHFKGFSDFYRKVFIEYVVSRYFPSKYQFEKLSSIEWMTND